MTDSDRSGGERRSNDVNPVRRIAARLSETSPTERLQRTGAAVRFAIGRRDGLGVGLLATLTYLIAYLWMTQQLVIRSGTGFDWWIVDDPIARLTERRGPLSFEPIGVLEFGSGTLLLAPIDGGIGLVVAILVGLNVALTYLAVVQPRSCGIGAGAGAFAAVPALLSGSVCCAPVVLLVLGIQASGTLLTVLPWLLPVGVTLLVGSLVLVGGLVSPDG